MTLLHRISLLMPEAIFKFSSMQQKTMKAITLPAYQGNIIRALRSLEIREGNLPDPRANEVLIEIDAAPANPSDLAFIQGGYNIKKALPAIPGFEGSGKVIGTGSDLEAKALNGKRVSFFSQSDHGGSWASHIPVNASDCIELEKDFPVEQAACFSVNPFTAYAMVDLARNSGATAIIQNAAAGQLGKFINILAGKNSIKVINIVRKETHVEMLTAAGCEHVLFSQDEGFLEKLHDLASTLKASIAFDAVGEEQSGQLLGAMPENSILYLYGALGGRTLSGIPASDVIFKKKMILGFNMNEWKEDLGKEAFLDISKQLQQLFKNGTLKTEIQGSFSLSEYEKALMQYIRGMSEGKIILVPK